MSDSIRRRLRVNPILCDGFGFCAEIVPELVSLDDWGFPIVKKRDVDTQDEDLNRLVERAVATCPRLALLMEDRSAEKP